MHIMLDCNESQTGFRLVLHDEALGALRVIGNLTHREAEGLAEDYPWTKEGMRLFGKMVSLRACKSLSAVMSN